MKKLALYIFIALPEIIAAASGDTSLVFKSASNLVTPIIDSSSRQYTMLYFHMNGCAPCRKMERNVFSNEIIFSFFNKHFLNIDVNTSKEKEKLIAAHYDVKLYPAFVFLDSNGIELHRVLGYIESETFLKIGENVLQNKETIHYYKTKLDSNSIATEELYKHVQLLREANQLKTEDVTLYLNRLDTLRFSDILNLRFIYDFSVVENKVFIPNDHPAIHFMQQNKSLFTALFDSAQVNIRLLKIFYRAAENAITDEDAPKLVSALVGLSEFDTGAIMPFRETDGRITSVTHTGSLRDNVIKQFLLRNSTNFKFLDAFARECLMQKQKFLIEAALKASERAYNKGGEAVYQETYANVLKASGKPKHAARVLRN